MNKYLALVCCLATLAYARPDVSLGYHYNKNYDSGSSVLSTPVVSTSYSGPASGGYSFGSTGSGSSQSANFLSPGYTVTSFGNGGGSTSDSSSISGLTSTGGSGFLGGTGGVNTYSTGLGGFGTNFGTGSSTIGVTTTGGSGFLGGTGGLGGYGTNYNTGIGTGVVNDLSVNTGANLGQYATSFANVAPLITKNIYVYSAPEDHDEQQVVRYINIGRPQRNYRVVFINAPSSTSTKAKIIAQVAPVEDRTAIYVLSKKNNALDVSADVINPGPVAPTKPDVFFIKYKTPEEALHAQHLVQAQYERYGGESHISNEGIIPVQSVIGSLGTAGSSSVSTTTSQVAPTINVISTGTVPQTTQYTTQYTGGIGPVQTGLVGFGNAGDSLSATTVQGSSQVLPSVNVVTTGVVPSSTRYTQYSSSTGDVPVQTGFSTGYGNSGSVTTIHGTSQGLPSDSVSVVSTVPDSSQVDEITDLPSNTYIPPAN